MKYEMYVSVQIRESQGGSSGLNLSETQSVELKTLSDAAMILVKLHEFFEAIKNSGTK